METDTTIVHSREEVDTSLADDGWIRGTHYDDAKFNEIYDEVVRLDMLNKGPIPEYLFKWVRRRHLYFTG